MQMSDIADNIKFLANGGNGIESNTVMQVVKLNADGTVNLILSHGDKKLPYEDSIVLRSPFERKGSPHNIKVGDLVFVTYFEGNKEEVLVIGVVDV